jgi:hypothetical protein
MAKMFRVYGSVVVQQQQATKVELFVNLKTAKALESHRATLPTRPCR